MNREIPISNVTVCPGCDMILATVPVQVPSGSHLLCPRCRFKVRSPKKGTIRRTLALALTGLILYVPAHFFILLTFDMLGLYDHGSVLDSFTSLYQQKYGLVSLVVLFTALVLPLCKLGLLFLVSLGVSMSIYPSLSSRMLRWYTHLQEWGMSEVYLIGIFVTIIKMEPKATITYETGFLCFVALVIVLTALSLVFDAHHFWDRIEVLTREKFRNRADRDAAPTMVRVQEKTRALTAGLIQCHTCHKVLAGQDHRHSVGLQCPRCGAQVHWRIRSSVNTTLALVITAIIFSFPANLLPIMEVELLGIPDRSTIMDGIIYFFQSGSYGIGLIILCASILVPVFKVLGLSILLYSIRFKRITRLLHKAIMFRFIAFIGRWSMLDIFVIALLCSLVNFGFFTTVRVAPAATFFTCVVLTTMFAAISFDERLLWDAAELNKQ